MSLTTYEVMGVVKDELAKDISDGIDAKFIPALRRTWKNEPDGPNDREVDIWYNSKWVPAFFSDIQEGDFFLDVKMGNIEAGKCFFAKSKVYRSVSPRTGWASFVVQGIEVVQAPAIKDINTIATLPDKEKRLLE
jgi:hypothetical protein